MKVGAHIPISTLANVFGMFDNKERRIDSLISECAVWYRCSVVILLILLFEEEDVALERKLAMPTPYSLQRNFYSF